jgi:hypothetical protein
VHRSFLLELRHLYASSSVKPFLAHETWPGIHEREVNGTASGAVKGCGILAHSANAPKYVPITKISQSVNQMRVAESTVHSATNRLLVSYQSPGSKNGRFVDAVGRRMEARVARDSDSCDSLKF